MPQYEIKIYPEALLDIQEAVEWYNDQLSGLGDRFQRQVVKQINRLKKNPEIYGVRYNDVHCMVVKKFPFMVHFTINNQIEIVTIFAIFHTSKNPQIWKMRTRE